ncbi:hypothetical protein [Lelliottia wanjuensis]|uniref:hypothetical protein n=1 Tax=Lelliottia wanjuensis TaxID=3050585 RepID=UPI00254EF3A5|nr:hypothetical protein [Lelliottia sp. V86_10]MDK9585866.1 hypothetical protein [Lelliottia sp. V86_10]
MNRSKLSLLALVLVSLSGAATASDYPFSAAHAVTEAIKEEFHQVYTYNTDSYHLKECSTALDGLEVTTQVDNPVNRELSKSYYKSFNEECSQVIDNKTFAGYADALEKVLPK